MICHDKTLADLPVLDAASLDPTVSCPLDLARQALEASATQSCGRDVFCREATRQVMTILADIGDGKPESGDLELVAELCGHLAQLGSCEMARASGQRTLDLLAAYPEEWRQHPLRKRCSSLTCQMSYTVYVDPAGCTGCQQCVPVCPVNAISGGPELIHVIGDAQCISCGACIRVCPVVAIKKAGPVKPKLPSAPIAVGSFETAAATGEGGMTRRRRRRGE